MTIAPPNLVTEIITITPEIAEGMLRRNSINRRLDQERVAVYAVEMSEGRWDFNAEPIQVDDQGELLNGQHRLTAIVLCGIPQQMLVVRNLPRKAMDNMDTGKKRSAGQTLLSHGEKNTSTLTAAIRVAIRREEKGKRRPIQTSEVLAWLEKHPEVREAVSITAVYAKDTYAQSKAILAYAMWRFRQIDPYQAETFLVDLAKRANLDYSDPVLALSRKFSDARRDRMHLTEEDQLSLYFRTWNARRAGRSLSRIPVRKAGDDVVDIPEPV